MKNKKIKYSFTLPDGTQQVFELELDGQTLELSGNAPSMMPPWTDLDFHKCPHCPLNKEDSPQCPLAVNLVNIIQRFDKLISYESIHLEVTTEERCISKETSAQRGIGSLMGLVSATSGCPHTAFFKPMAYFHLPLASREETIYRAASTYLLGQYLLKNEGRSHAFELDGLRTTYENIQVVNTGIAERLRSATDTDSSVNAIVFLDMYAKAFEIVIEDYLKEIQFLFDSYLHGDST
jgi:hypothetical protein